MAASASDIDIERLQQETSLSVEFHQSLDSTSDRARQFVAAGQAEPLPRLVIAENQTAGRGRGANRWWTGRGSLAFTLVTRADHWGPLGSVAPPISLAVGVALVEALEPLLSGHQVGLHWPNDLIVDNRKLSGVLVEWLAGSTATGGHLLIGVGLNVNNTLQEAPPEVRTRATTLYELTGTEHPRTPLLLTILAHIDQAMQQLVGGDPRLFRKFDKLCLQKGQRLLVETPQGTLTGRCQGVGADGGLLLETDAGLQSVFSGTTQPADSWAE